MSLLANTRAHDLAMKGDKILDAAAGDGSAASRTTPWIQMAGNNLIVIGCDFTQGTSTIVTVTVNVKGSFSGTPTFGWPFRDTSNALSNWAETFTVSDDDTWASPIPILAPFVQFVYSTDQANSGDLMDMYVLAADKV